MANYRAKKSGCGLMVKRGQLLTSVLALSKRWLWSRGKVSRFLTELVNRQDIDIKRTNSGTLITMLKYKDYGGLDSDKIGKQTALDVEADTKQGTQEDLRSRSCTPLKPPHGGAALSFKKRGKRRARKFSNEEKLERIKNSNGVIRNEDRNAFDMGGPN